MNGVGPDGPTSPPSGQQPPTLPPIPNVEQQPSTSAVGQGRPNGSLSLQLPPLSFDSTPINAGDRPPEDRRPLSPITERTTPMDSRSLSSEKPIPGRTTAGATISPLGPQTIREESTSSILQEPLVTSPTASSPPPGQNVMGRASVESYPQAPGSRPDSKLSHRPGQISGAPSRSSSSQPSSPALPSPTYHRQQTSPEPRPMTPSTPPRFAAIAAQDAMFPPRASSPLRVASPPSSPPILATQPQPPIVPSQASSFTRMVPDRSTSQVSIPTSMYTIPTPSSRASHSTQRATPPAPLYSPTTPPLSQAQPPPSQKKMSVTDDILGDAGAALFYMQHMQQQEGAPPVRRRGPPPSANLPQGEEDDETPSDESESEPYTPPPRAATSPLRVKQANSPPPSGTSSMHPPAVPTKSPPPSTANQAFGPGTEPPSAPRPGSALRKPSGARAAPTNRMSAFLQNSPPARLPPTGSTSATTAPATDDDDDDAGDEDDNFQNNTYTMAAAAHDGLAYEDTNADALAALSFLEQEDRPAPPSIPPQSPPARSAGASSARSPPLPEVVETPASPSQARVAEQPRSSFAPTRLAAERKAKSQAQQAALQAAAHRPGKANGKGRPRAKDTGAWGESSEEEEEEEEDDEDVDSDTEPPPRMAGSVSDHASTQGPGQRSPYGAGTGSPARSATDVNAGAFPPRRPRDLPQLPGGQRAYPSRGAIFAVLLWVPADVFPELQLPKTTSALSLSRADSCRRITQKRVAEVSTLRMAPTGARRRSSGSPGWACARRLSSPSKTSSHHSPRVLRETCGAARWIPTAGRRTRPSATPSSRWKPPRRR